MSPIPAQHKDDEAVGDEGDEDEEGHDPTIDGFHQLQWSKPGGHVHLVAGPGYFTPWHRVFNMVNR